VILLHLVIKAGSSSTGIIEIHVNILYMHVSVVIFLSDPISFLLMYGISCSISAAAAELRSSAGGWSSPGADEKSSQDTSTCRNGRQRPLPTKCMLACPDFLSWCLEAVRKNQHSSQHQLLLLVKCCTPPIISLRKPVIANRSSVSLLTVKAVRQGWLCAAECFDERLIQLLP
jgi:hypothetical protein